MNWSIQLVETRKNCKGVGPSIDEEKNLNEKRPFAYKMIYIYKDKKCIDSLRTDSSGMVHVKLKSGKYGFFLPWKHFKGIPTGNLSDYDMDCLKKEWLRPDDILELKKIGSHFDDNTLTYQFCSWQYNCLRVRQIPPSKSK